MSAVAQRLRLEGSAALGRRRAARLFAVLILGIHAADRVVVVRLVEHVVNVFVVKALRLEIREGLLDVLEVPQVKGDRLELLTKSLLERSVLVVLFVDGLLKAHIEDLVCSGLIRLVSPLLANLIEPLEVDGSPAHRAALACTLQIPRLDTAAAKAMTAGQLAAGVVTVANGTLHLVCSALCEYLF